MYQSLFGYANREAQLRAIEAKRNATQTASSHQCHDGISYNPPPPYSKLSSKRHVAVAMTSDPETLKDPARSL
jgi:hypothetical protein